MLAPHDIGPVLKNCKDFFLDICAAEKAYYLINSIDTILKIIGSNLNAMAINSLFSNFYLRKWETFSKGNHSSCLKISHINKPTCFL